MLILPSWLSAASFPIKSSRVNSSRPKSALRSLPTLVFGQPAGEYWVPSREGSGEMWYNPETTLVRGIHTSQPSCECSQLCVMAAPGSFPGSKVRAQSTGVKKFKTLKENL